MSHFLVHITILMWKCFIACDSRQPCHVMSSSSRIGKEVVLAVCDVYIVDHWWQNGRTLTNVTLQSRGLTWSMEVPEAGPVPGLSNPIQPGQILSDHYLQHYTVLHVTSQNYRSSASPAQMVNYMSVCLYSFSGVMLASSHGARSRVDINFI